jgi:hypothetical protein
VIAAVPFFEGKKKYLDYLRSKKDVISWTGLVTGPFFDWVSMKYLPAIFEPTY